MKTLLLAVLIFFGVLRQSYERDFQEVEGHEFHTPGGSICNYHSLHDPTEQMTAINIHCHCKSNDELFKYSCTYQGGVKDCPKYKENRKIFYTEMIEIFESKTNFGFYIYNYCYYYYNI
jgi:hypothetical protein